MNKKDDLAPKKPRRQFQKINTSVLKNSQPAQLDSNASAKSASNVVVNALNREQSRILVAAQLARLADIFKAIGQELKDLMGGVALDMLNEGLGAGRQGSRRVGGLPGVPASEGPAYENPLGSQGDVGLPSNRPGPFDSMLRSPDPRDALGGIASRGGTIPTPTPVPGTERHFAISGTDGESEGTSVIMTDGTQVTTGVGIQSDGTQTIFTDVSDSHGNGKTTTVIITSDGRSAVITNTHDGYETTDSQGYGNVALITAEGERLQRVERDRRRHLERTQDPDSGSTNPWGYYNPLTGQYWGPERKTSPDQVNPGREGSVAPNNGPRLAVDPKTLVINPNPEAFGGAAKPISPRDNNPNQVDPPRDVPQ